MSANVATRPLYPIPAWQARLLDLAQDIIDWFTAEMARPVPRAVMEPMIQPEPDRGSWGLVRRGWALHYAPEGHGAWLTPWVVEVIEMAWNWPKYALTLLRAGALMAGAHWLSGWSMVFAVLMAVCAYGAWRCCVALAQADWHAMWRDLRRGLRHLHRRSARPARRLKLGSKSVPVGRRGWAA